MNPTLALKLVVVLEAYFSREEVGELARLYELQFNTLDQYNQGQQWSWLPFVRELVENLDRGNFRPFLDSILDLASSRNMDGLAHTTWERQTYHQSLVAPLREANEALDAVAAPAEIAVPAGSLFTAKSRVRDLLESAADEIFIVDPYVGVGTLDCLRTVAVPVQLLTANMPQSIEPGFDRALATFNAEGHHVTVRRAGHLHDRHILFNDRCWLVGGSLKDAGKKAFNCIELVDGKDVVRADLEAKWQAATPFP